MREVWCAGCAGAIIGTKLTYDGTGSIGPAPTLDLWKKQYLNTIFKQVFKKAELIFFKLKQTINYITISH